MKSVVILAVLLLSAAAVLGQGNFGTMTCCSRFVDASAIKSGVKKYAETHAMCRLKGIIVTTNSGKRVCVDPKHELIMKLTKDMQSNSTE